MVAVRPFVDEDYDSIGRIYFDGERAALREAYPSGFSDEWFQPRDVAESIEQCKLFFASHVRASAAFVAEDGGRVIGMTLVAERDEDPGVGQVSTLYVDPACWRRGVGSMLLQAGTAWLRERYPTAMLWTIAENRRARAFYESHGWRDTGEMWKPGHTPPLVRYDARFDARA